MKEGETMVDIARLGNVVGRENVLSDGTLLDGFARDESGISGVPPACVLKPRSTEEIRSIIELAASEKFFIIPVSSGGPRHRGDTVPAVKDAVIVDLSGMKKIVRLDVRNKVALIEPGVTFSELKADV